MQDFLQFWGKAQPTNNDTQAWHPLAWHSLDVAACAEILLNEIFHSVGNKFGVLSGSNESAASLLLVRLAALHDIGKFSIGFQFKAPQHFPNCLDRGNKTPNGDHTAIGLYLLQSEFSDIKAKMAPGIDTYAWNVLVGAVAGHHGRPVGASNLSHDEIGCTAIEAARTFANKVLTAISGDPFPGTLTDKQVKPFSYLLAGFINLADWIGSNQSHFHYEKSDMPLIEYWENFARKRARKALANAGLAFSTTSRQGGFHALTGQIERSPSPLQRHAETLELPSDGPCFFIVEDLTGAGKTEAALILAHRLMLSGRADGLFVALPTMATANAMYARLADTYRRLFTLDASPSLALSHGAARLHDDFQDSILDVGNTKEQPYGHGGDDDVPASASCATWIGQDRRRAFFAHVGVGTIDQAFLSVLPVKFAALRMLGLSRRVLILDEIHSYEAYENEELKRLIQFHAAQGGSVIALSATLPETTKDGLVAAWRNGLRIRHKTVEWPVDYPLCTMVDGEGEVRPNKVETRVDLPRTVTVERLPDETAAIEAVLAAAETGACVAWIRNTVDEVLAAQTLLDTHGMKARVFHARFAMYDRQKIETAVVDTFGYSSTPEQRRGQIIVASQVIEQSLDLDFDLIVSDLAPIDLLIQRAGRLWRHKREGRPLSAPRLLVVSPEPIADAKADWLSVPMRGTSYVYRDHARMWQTAKVLFAASAIVSPSNVRHLVEQVYGTDALASVPTGLQRRHLEAEGSASAGRSTAQLNLLKLCDGYAEHASWAPEVYTPTRLGEERTIFRLACWKDSALQPWAGDITVGLSPREEERLWALSEVAIRRGRASGRGNYVEEVERAATRLETAWNEKGGAVVLPLLECAEGFEAFLTRGNEAQKETIRVFYSRERGVVFNSAR